MNEEKIFADGMRFELPGEKAPTWIKGKISINADKFIAFVEQYKNERGWLNLDVKESKNGTLYVELNTYNLSKQKTQYKTTKTEEKTDEGADSAFPPDVF